MKFDEALTKFKRQQSYIQNGDYKFQLRCDDLLWTENVVLKYSQLLSGIIYFQLRYHMQRCVNLCLFK